MSQKMARNSLSKPWECKKPWPDDCFVQCGDSGIVLPSGSMNKVITASDVVVALVESAASAECYTTAFFEAFPRNPDTFIRGEGTTIEAAEADAFAQYDKFLACSGHEFERRGYTNGAGFCKHCGMFKSKVFEPTPEEP